MINHSVQLLLFSFFAIPASIIDIKRLKLPDYFTIPCFFAVLISSLVLQKDIVLTSFISSFLTVLFCLIIKKATRGLGSGDIKLILSSAFITGFPGVFLMLFFSTLVPIVLYILLSVMHKFKNEPFAFGPYITLGTILTKILQIFGYI